MLFGANSVVGKAILEGLVQKYQGLRHTCYDRSEIQFGLSRLGSLHSGPLIVVISIGILHSDALAGTLGLFRQFKINVTLCLQVLEVALSNLSVREIHIASSVAALAARPGFRGYHISKRALDDVVREVVANPPNDVAIFVWRLPFIPSPMNLGRKSPPILHASAEELAASVASESKPGILYLRRSHRILGKFLVMVRSLQDILLDK